jgi:hypothetical protein
VRTGLNPHSPANSWPGQAFPHLRRGVSARSQQAITDAFGAPAQRSGSRWLPRSPFYTGRACRVPWGGVRRLIEGRDRGQDLGTSLPASAACVISTARVALHPVLNPSRGLRLRPVTGFAPDVTGLFPLSRSPCPSAARPVRSSQRGGRVVCGVRWPAIRRRRVPPCFASCVRDHARHGGLLRPRYHRLLGGGAWGC